MLTGLRVVFDDDSLVADAGLVAAGVPGRGFLLRSRLGLMQEGADLQAMTEEIAGVVAPTVGASGMSVFRGPRWSVGPDWVLVPFAVPQPEPDRATLRTRAALAGVTCGWIYGLFPQCHRCRESTSLTAPDPGLSTLGS